MTITNITERERELSVRVAELEAELAAVRNQQPIGAVGDMGRDRAIIWYDYHTKLPVGTLVYLDAGAQPAQQEPEGPLVDGWQITLSDGHAGYGVYAHMMEYPDEGAIFLLSAGAQPVPEAIKEVVVHADYRAMWKQATKTNQELCEALAKAQPVPEGWQIVPIDVVNLYAFMDNCFVPMTSQQDQINVQLNLARKAMSAKEPK